MRCSMGCGATYLPPEVLNSSFLRSVMRRYPSSSSVADVAGLEPAVFGEDLARRVGLVVVAAHDVGAARLDLAVRGDAHLDVADGAADRADAIVFQAVDGDDGRGLGQPVALDDGQPRAVEDVARAPPGAPRRPRRRGVYARPSPRATSRRRAARRRLCLKSEQRADGLASEHGRARPLLPDVDGPRQQTPSSTRPPSAALLLDARVNLLEEARDGDDDRRAHLAHVVADASPCDSAKKTLMPWWRYMYIAPRSKTCESGSTESATSVGREGEALGGVDQVRDEVRVREHDALRLARRPRRVDDRRQVVGADRAREFVDEAGLLRVELRARALRARRA